MIIKQGDFSDIMGLPSPGEVKAERKQTIKKKSSLNFT
jgi:hypothetical protein